MAIPVDISVSCCGCLVEKGQRLLCRQNWMAVQYIESTSIFSTVYIIENIYVLCVNLIVWIAMIQTSFQHGICILCYRYNLCNFAN